MSYMMINDQPFDSNELFSVVNDMFYSLIRLIEYLHRHAQPWLGAMTEYALYILGCLRDCLRSYDNITISI